jgi:hypothetical protein
MDVLKLLPGANIVISREKSRYVQEKYYVK